MRGPPRGGGAGTLVDALQTDVGMSCTLFGGDASSAWSLGKAEASTCETEGDAWGGGTVGGVTPLTPGAPAPPTLVSKLRPKTA